MRTASTCLASSFLACFALYSASSGNPPPAQALAPSDIASEVFETGWFEGDCAYHAVHVSPDGKVYFSVSTHSAQQSAHVYVFEPATKRVRLLWTADQTIPRDGSVTHGKIHSPIAEMGGDLYVGTHDAWYYTDHTDPATGKPQTPYKGGCVVAIDKEAGKGRLIARPMAGRPATAYVYGNKDIEKVPVEGEALVATIMDTTNGLFYALTWPSGYFVKVDVKSGKTTEYGRQCMGAESVPKLIEKDGRTVQNPDYYQVNRTLALDGDGNVYGSRGNGEIWKYAPKSDKVTVMSSRMEQGSGMPIAPEAAQRNQWRTVLWDPTDRVFYGVVHATSWLFRLDPAADRIEPVTAWRPEKALKDKIQKDYAQLGLAMGPNHTLFGLVHADRIRPTAKRSVRLITFDLDRKQYKDRGVVHAPDGSALMFAESCAVTPGGEIYTVGWMEAGKDRYEQVKAQREKGPPEVRGFGYLMSLVRMGN